jgi:hypothetical protein
MWVEHHRFANCQIQVKGRSTVSVLRKPLMLEARGSNMLFTSEN